MVKINLNIPIFQGNDENAAINRHRLLNKKLIAVNLMASPGAGKTSLLLKLLEEISKTRSVFVIEGDVASRVDADKILSHGFSVHQINTDGACHLDAKSIGEVIDTITIQGPGFVFIENIGNLICPTEFDLGESFRIVESSVPEGDDKPIKYPDIFKTADIIVLNKIDLLAHVEFNVDSFISAVEKLNQKAPIFIVSCKTGEGISQVVAWLLAKLDIRLQESL